MSRPDASGQPERDSALIGLLKAQAQEESALLHRYYRRRINAEENDLAQRNRALQEENALLEQRCRKAEDDLRQVIGTTSWRVTKPLRGLSALLRGRGKGKAPQASPGAGAAAALMTLVDPQEMERQRACAFRREITFSVITPLYNTPARYLDEMVESVRNQTYVRWELCLADGSDDQHPEVEAACRRLAAEDARIRYRKLERNLGISGNSNAAMDLATGEWFVLLDHDDLLHPSALFHIAEAVQDGDADFVYTDECIFDRDPLSPLVEYYKTGFAPDTLLGHNYICHITSFARELLAEAGGGFRPEYDGSQDYDLVLRLTEKARRVVHIPKVLYFWRSAEQSTARDIHTKLYAIDAAKAAILAHLDRLGRKAGITNRPEETTYRITYPVDGEPEVSVVVPGTGSAVSLYRCVESVRARTAWKNLEIVIAVNARTEAAALPYIRQLEETDPRVRVVRQETNWNDTALFNAGAAEARGEYLVMLDQNTEIITPDWVENMLMHAQWEEVGAVGALLYYPDDTVRHAGVALRKKEDLYFVHQYKPRGDSGYFDRLRYVQDLAAVSGGCVMLPKKAFTWVGRFDEKYGGVLRDVDLCLRLREAGCRVLWTPFAELYRYDAAGSDAPSERERTLFMNKWKHRLEDGDPYTPEALILFSR